MRLFYLASVFALVGCGSSNGDIYLDCIDDSGSLGASFFINDATGTFGKLGDDGEYYKPCYDCEVAVNAMKIEWSETDLDGSGIQSFINRQTGEFVSTSRGPRPSGRQMIGDVEVSGAVIQALGASTQRLTCHQSDGPPERQF